MPRPASTSVIPEGHLTIVRRLQRRDPLRAAQVPTPEERLIRWPVTGQPSLRGILGVEGRVAQIEDSFRNFEYFGAVWIKGSHMMGQQNQQKELFGYSIDLDRRVRPDNPLRKIGARIDFSFARAEVEHTYGHNGNVSVDPVVILKMMFLLFLDNIASERELMQIIPERLDYLWFLGYGLNDQVPNHSVLSKARTRWGTQVFEQLFLRTVGECVAAGLVEGKKIHLDGSLIAANASTDSVVAGSAELIAALRQAYRDQAAKLSEEVEVLAEPTPLGPVNQTHLSTTDPQSELARGRSTASRPSYKHHRAVDNAHGVITAHATTGGSVKEDTQLVGLVQQHRDNTAVTLETVVADSQYGTVENFLKCVDRGIHPHMADLKTAQEQGQRRSKLFAEDQFIYDAASDTYRCPAGQVMKRWQKRAEKNAYQYMAKSGTCDNCRLRAQCTQAKGGRRIQRFDRQDELAQARAQSQSKAAQRDRRRRKHLMEGSFADAANNHGFKRARWRGLWRQKIQNHLIAACQNIRILLGKNLRQPSAALAMVLEDFLDLSNRVYSGNLPPIDQRTSSDAIWN
jgi:transposase